MTSSTRPDHRRAAPRRVGRPRRALQGLLAWAVVAAGAVSPLVALGVAVPAEAASTPWSVEAAPVAQLRDGQTVTVTVKTTVDFPIYQAVLHVCRAGVTYQPSTAERPDVDFARGGANCPLSPISSSADAEVVDTRLLQQSTKPEGEIITTRVGTGSQNWDDSTTGAKRSLTCDVSNPCALVVELLAGPGTPTWIPWSTVLTYKDDNPITGCGGPAAGILATGGSDRMTDPWIDWTLSACKQGTIAGAPSRASFVGEGPAVQAFNDGSLDLAYTAAGLDPQVDLLGQAGAPPPPNRPSVAVPVALNATVLAVGNGRPGPNGRKVPYGDIKLTVEEVATLLSGGPYGMGPYLDAIYARNPELRDGGFFNTSSSFVVGGPAEAATSSWIMTNYLKTLRPDAWRVPLGGTFGADAGRARTVTASLTVADPTFQNALTLLTGRPSLRKNLDGFGGSDFGGVWVLTDLATAKALELTPVSIENAAGAFVAPTPASLAAAVPTMRRTAAGTLLPDPRAVKGTAPASAAGVSAGIEPYPLTQVEYALAPTEKLIDPLCQARPASDALLSFWLGYVTTSGQSSLQTGYAALPPSLAAEAARLVPAVAASPSTRDCPPPDGPVTSAAPPEAPPTSDTFGAPVLGDPTVIPDAAVDPAFDAAGGPDVGGDFSAGSFADGAMAGDSPDSEGTGANAAKRQPDASFEPVAVAVPRFGEGRAYSTAIVGGALLLLLLGFTALVKVQSGPSATGEGTPGARPDGTVSGGPSNEPPS